jgi:hypothetical protein|tara:strand:+ start:517 stop:1695 length:1179 start_codon:yes stop_codon:yes gene_type:complete
MSSGKNLQEMEVGTTPSKTAANANAAPGNPLPKAGSNASGVTTPGNSAQVEDLGGPTPDNYSPTNDSAKLKPAGGTLKQVRDVVNKNATAGDSEAGTSATPVKMEEVEVSDEVVSEEEEVTNEVVAEEESTTEEVVEETTEDEVVAEAPDYTEISIEEDVKALVEGEELSEEFKEKAKTILEAAVKGKVVQIKEVLDAEYEAKLLEEVEEIKGALNERVDSYLEYVSDEWFTENQLAVQGGLKEELTESFMTGLKSLFEEHYVTIPEEKYDVLQSMVEKLDDMESKLNEQIEKNVSLNQRLSESASDVILADVSEGLADTQREKLASLSESVEFVSEETYREKLETLKESYFPTKANPAVKSESLSEGVDSSPEVASGTMAKYLKTLSQFNK